jgi:hypothetical protein
MSELVTMRITLDPVLKEQLKLRAIERGMTHGELLPRLLAQGLQSEPDKPTVAPTDTISGNHAVLMEPAAEIEDALPPDPSVQEIVTQLLSDHAALVTEAFALIAAREERIEQLCVGQQGRFDKAVEAFSQRADAAVEKSTREWQGVLRVRRQNRYWLGGAAAAAIVVIWIMLALISGTSLGRRFAVWQTGADTEWQAAQSLASHGSYLHGELMAETRAFLDNPEFRTAYAKCIDRAKAAKASVRCTLLFPALSARP